VVRLEIGDGAARARRTRDADAPARSSSIPTARGPTRAPPRVDAHQSRARLPKPALLLLKAKRLAVSNLELLAVCRIGKAA
jgi:hypothetical protein